MTEMIAQNIELAASHAHIWGFFLIFFFMTVESSFIPFPSEVVMIPAGFLAYRGELSTGIPWLDLVLSVVAGLLGSLAGAYVNYFLALKLGRPFLHRYGKYFFLKEKVLDRAEEVFREYGELATFVCRLLPGIRQLISIPAGVAKMNFWRFTLFTGLGAGIWTLILALIGWGLGHMTGDMSYVDMVHRGKEMIQKNFIWLALGLGVLVVGYLAVHHFVMKSKSSADEEKPVA